MKGRMHAIEARGLTKVYRGLWRRRGGQEALRGVDLVVPQGTAFGLIGPNGAGKTTLFKMITGAEKPDAGSFKVGETVSMSYVDQSRSSPLRRLAASAMAAGKLT